jgi:hypothetical protein
MVEDTAKLEEDSEGRLSCMLDAVVVVAAVGNIAEPNIVPFVAEESVGEQDLLRFAVAAERMLSVGIVG